MTERVPAALAVLLLAREAVDKGRPELAVAAATLRAWKHRKYLSGGRGYDLTEVIAHLARRDETSGRSALVAFP